ncbi:MAG: serine/threonine protein kinase [candidate division Zixibacteria bacterium]|nr:serine/threonine protein kinase [candidate division Zixibacteria bacterium]
MEIKQIGQYSTVEVLGEGLNGVVYRGWDMLQNRPVALKLIREQAKQTSFKAARATLEALIGIDHPNLGAVSEIGEVDGQTFIVSELLSGKTLQQVLIEEPAGPHDFLRIAEQVSRGLDRLHQRGLVHGNLRPSNIMLADDGTIKLLDAGLSIFRTGYKHVGVVPPYEPLHYLAPEQFGEGSVDFRTDHFSLGTVLYRCATGELPFTGSSEEELISAITQMEPDYTLLKGLDIRGDSVLLIEKLLAKNPDDRFTSSEHLKITVAEMVSFEREARFKTGVGAPAKDPRKYLLISAMAVVLIVLWYIFSTARQ